MGRKITIEEIKQYVEENSECDFINAEYREMEDKRKWWYLKLQCPCGNFFERRFNDFRREKIKKCNKCKGRDFHTYEEIKNFIENICGDWLSLTLVDKEYKSYEEKLTVVDYEGYKYFISLHGIISDRERNNYPAIVGSYNLYSIENIHNYIKINNINIKLLSDVYIDNNHKLLWECNEGHKFEMIWDAFLQGQRCKECYFINNRGENHPNWKGGTTFISSYLRDYLIDWKKDSIRNCNYKCIITGGKFNVIHHLYGFNLIVQEIIQENNIKLKNNINEYTEGELSILKKEIIKKHNKYLLGVCLCKEIHNLFHYYYGLGDNTPEQFEEFKENYYKGLYDNELDKDFKSYNSIKRLKLQEVS